MLILLAMGRAALAAMSAAPALTFDYFLSDMSGMNVWDAAWVTTVNGGESAHTLNGTSTTGTWLNFKFVGTGFTIHGRGTPQGVSSPFCRVDSDTKVDVTPDGAGGSLATISGLPWGPHSVGLNAGRGEYSISGTTITTGMESSAESFDTVPLRKEELVRDGQANPFFSYTGAWNVTSVGHEGDEGSYASLDGEGVLSLSLAHATVPVPRGTSYLVLNGTVCPECGKMFLEWSPQPMWLDTSLVVDTYSDVVAPATLFLTPLDPDVEYNLTIKSETPTRNTRPHTRTRLHSVTFYAANGSIPDTKPPSPQPTPSPRPTPGKKTPIGAIVGGVVGGVLGLIALAVLLFCFLRRRRRRASSAANTPPIASKWDDIQQHEHKHDPSADGPPLSTHHGVNIESDAGYVPESLPPRYDQQWKTEADARAAQR